MKSTQNNEEYITFTIEGVSYPLCDKLKEHFIELSLQEETMIDAWFDGPLLTQKYKLDNGEIEESVIDVISVFESHPQKTKEILDDAGLRQNEVLLSDTVVEYSDWR